MGSDQSRSSSVSVTHSPDLSSFHSQEEREQQKQKQKQDSEQKRTSTPSQKRGASFNDQLRLEPQSPISRGGANVSTQEARGSRRSKTWVLYDTKGKHEISLEHDTIGGRRLLIADGWQIAFKPRVLMDSGDVYIFLLNSPVLLDIKTPALNDSLKIGSLSKHKQKHSVSDSQTTLPSPTTPPTSSSSSSSSSSVVTSDDSSSSLMHCRVAILTHLLSFKYTLHIDGLPFSYYQRYFASHSLRYSFTFSNNTTLSTNKTTASSASSTTRSEREAIESDSDDDSKDDNKTENDENDELDSVHAIVLLISLNPPLTVIVDDKPVVLTMIKPDHEEFALYSSSSSSLPSSSSSSSSSSSEVTVYTFDLVDNDHSDVCMNFVVRLTSIRSKIGELGSSSSCDEDDNFLASAPDAIHDDLDANIDRERDHDADDEPYSPTFHSSLYDEATVSHQLQLLRRTTTSTSSSASSSSSSSSASASRSSPSFPSYVSNPLIPMIPVSPPSLDLDPDSDSDFDSDSESSSNDNNNNGSNKLKNNISSLPLPHRHGDLPSSYTIYGTGDWRAYATRERRKREKKLKRDKDNKKKKQTLPQEREEIKDVNS